MSKTAEKIAHHLTAKGWVDQLLWYAGAGTAAFRVYLVQELDAALEGKIISKDELSALRKDVANMADAQKAYNFSESSNKNLRNENAEWKVVANEKENEYVQEYEAHTETVRKLVGAELENDNLKRDIENLKADVAGYQRANQILEQKNVNLKWDIAALQTNWTSTTLPEPFKWSAAAQANAYAPAKSKAPGAGQYVPVVPCDICGILEPPGAGHTHTGFEKFIARLFFWK